MKKIRLSEEYLNGLMDAYPNTLYFSKVIKECYEIFLTKINKEMEIPVDIQKELFPWFLSGFIESLYLIENKIDPQNLFKKDNGELHDS